MGLSTALGAALSGLKTTQRGLDLTAANVANSQTVGYTRKTLVTQAQVTGGTTTGVEVSEVRRELDVYLQRQLRSETAGGAYAGARADYLDRLQGIFGTPGGSLSLDTTTSDFSSALSSLATSPDDQNARGAVIAQAQVLAQTLNSASRDVQSLRSQADQSISDAVTAANEALTTIDRFSKQITAAQARGEPTGDLKDLRDTAIDTLASIMDVRVEDLANGDVRLRTSSGLTLYDAGPSTLSFEPAGSISAEDSYGAGASTLSGVMLTRPSGQSTDLLGSGQLRSGQIRALADMRDQALTQAQGQLDELAANIAQALGTNVTNGETIPGGVSLTTDGALSGDKLSISYTSGGVTRSVTLVNVKDPTKLPLADGVTPDPNDTVIGVDFSSPTAAADINAALASRGVAMTASATADGLSFTSGAGLAITGGQSRITASSLTGDGLALPLFVDAGTGDPYSASLDGEGQTLGFAGRITVNPALIADPSLLTSYASGTTAGDASRPEFLRDAMTAKRSFSPSSGLGGTSAPFSGSVGQFAQGIISMQARASATATRVSEGQSLVVSSLQDRFTSASGVNVDEEMSNLIQLQTAYGANARVITAVKEMIDMLMRI